MGWLGAVLVLLGYLFNAHHYILCWPIWIVGNILVALYSVNKEAYSTAVMSFVLVIINIYGWMHWTL